MRFNLFEVIVLVGIVQGFFISALIFLRSSRSVSKILLAAVLIIFNLLCVKILVHTTGLWQTHGLRYVPLGVELAIQPLIWLYIRSLIQPDFTFGRKYLGHFIPVAFSMAYSIFIYVVTRSESNPVDQDTVANGFLFNAVKQVEDYLSIVSSVVYWFLGVRLLTRYRRWLFQNVSDADYHTLYWLRNVAVLLGLLIALLAMAILLDTVFHFSLTHFVHWQIFFIYLSVLIYIIGFKGYRMADTKHSPVSVEAAQPILKPASLEDSGLSPEKQEQVRLAILHALEVDELYLDPELNLSKLAGSINVSASVTSKVINACFNKSFRNLVNEYRIGRVKKMLRHPNAAHLSIAGIASECGFNSEASFYRIFKSIEGVSPRAFIGRV